MTGTCCVLWRVKMLTFVDDYQDERVSSTLKINPNCELWDMEQ